MCECTLCGKDFANKYTMARHQKTCKVLNEQEPVFELNLCQYCDLEFSTKGSLTRHQLSCNNIEDLQNKLKDKDKLL